MSIKNYIVLRILTFNICLILLISSFGNFFAKPDSINNSMCYGFVVPLPQGEDTTLETFTDSKVRHMINDLLREKITIYWSEDDFSVLSKPLDMSYAAQEIFYKKGAFIIPFSGDVYKDALLISIISDYNQTHELENQSLIQNEAYLLMQTIDTNTDILVEPKIAQYLGVPIRYSWPCYLQIAEAGGFLTYEFLLDNESQTLLNNNDFNVFMWPYNPDPANMYETIKSITNIAGCNAIRCFVSNGGGYIGSCYGAFVGSSGFLRPIPLFYLRHAYNPNLPFLHKSIAYSLSDSLMSFSLFVNYTLCISISNLTSNSHPVTFGVNKTFQDFFEGSWFVWLGKNTHALAYFQDLKPINGTSDKSSDLKDLIVRKPSWVDSKFGDGKIVLFSSHPEFVINISLLFKGIDWNGDPYYGRRPIYNALFYVTSKENSEPINYKCYELSFIISLMEKTDNLPIYGISKHDFDDLRKRINNFYYNISYLKNITIDLQELFKSLDDNNTNFEKDSRILKYVFLYCDIYQYYNNRSIKNIDELEQVVPMLYKFNESIIERVNGLKNDLNWRLNESEKIVLTTLSIAKNLKEKLLLPRISIFQKIQLYEERRDFLRTFEIGLKYIPQIYFGTLKLVRHCWYNYEANIATNLNTTNYL
ncbi:MAG: hypothetical protein MUO82_01300 [Candidatus Thermoplasmatota archaeon]|nr:hypothetical protein [Candidatus Thermoplasmatota archaeon]